MAGYHFFLPKSFQNTVSLCSTCFAGKKVNPKVFSLSHSAKDEHPHGK